MADASVMRAAATAVPELDVPVAPPVLTVPWLGERDRRSRRTGEGRLVEREDEIAVLRRGIRGVLAGRSGRVTVVGRRGAGRSALLAAAVREARVAGMITAFASCSPVESEVHRGVINRLFADIAGADCRLDGGPRSCCRASAERSIPTLCGDFVGVASQGPLLIAVDDAQWADPGSKAWLEAMEHRLQQAPILLVRSILSAGEPLSARAGGEDTVVAAPLTEDGLRQLIADRFPGSRQDPRFATGVHLATGGLPALVAPVLERLSAAGQDPLAVHLPAVTEHLADVRIAGLAVSIAALPADALNLVRATAMCRGLLDFDLVTTLAGPLAGAVGDALHQLIGLGLVREGAPTHIADDATADAALGTLSAAKRGELAARCADLAYRAAVPDDQLAELLTGVRPTGTTWAVATLRRAAEQRRALDDDLGAARLLRRALREPVSPAERRKLMLGLALAEAAGKPELSDLRLQRVLLDTGPEVSGAVLLEAADHLLSHGDTRTAHRVIAATCLRRSGFETGTSALAALGWLAQEDCAAGPVVPAPVFGAPSAPGGDVDPVRAVTNAVALARRGRRPSRARELARLALAPRANLPHGLRTQAAWVLMCTDDLSEAVLSLTDIQQDAMHAGARAAAANALLLRARCELRRGNLGQAEADLEAAVARLPERAWHPRALPGLRAVRAEAALAAMWLDEAEKAVAAPIPAGADDGQAAGYLLLQRGRVHLETGHPAAALDDFRAAGRGTSGRREGNPLDLPWRTGAAVALARLGDAAAATDLAREAWARTDAWDVPGARGTTSLRLAEVFTGEERREYLARAVGVLERTFRRVEFLTAVTELAVARLDDGDTTEAAALLGRVATLRPQLLPAGLAEKIRDVSGRLARRAPDAARPAPGDPTGALSEQEARIAALAAAGRTNPEIARTLQLSSRLVELRLTRIYRKLTVSGRGQLTELMSPGSAAS